MEKKRRILLAGGGTGGHVFPALAVARELLKRGDVEVRLVGRESGVESKWAAEAGVSFSGIPARGMPFALSPRMVPFLAALARGFAASRRILGSFRPEVVFATGGYVSVPVALAARLRGVPLYLLEPNVLPGRAACLLARLARVTFLGFAETAKHLPRRARTVHTGVPVREEILRQDRAEARRALGLSPDAVVLLLLGGSQGSRTLNQAMADLVRFLAEGDRPVQVLFMTGWTEFRERAAQLEGCPLKLVLRPFFSDIHRAYAAADLLIARAGALTCAEACARGLPSVLVPYPHAGGHQEANARALERAGAAKVLSERDAVEGRLVPGVLSLLNDPGLLAAMADSARSLGREDAAAVVASRLLAREGGER